KLVKLRLTPIAQFPGCDLFPIQRVPSLYLSAVISWTRRAALVLFGVTLITPSIAQKKSSLATTPLSSRTIVVATPNDAYPLSYANESGQTTGFAVELLDTVARIEGLTLRRVSAPQAELYRRFDNGEFDLINLYSVPIQQPLAVETSDPFLVFHGALYIRKDLDDIHTLADLAKVDMIIVGTSSIGEQMIHDHHVVPREIRHTNSIDEAFHLIERNEADVVYASRAIASSIIDRDHLRNIRILPIVPQGYERRHSFAVHKGDPLGVLAAVNDGLAATNRNGEYARIYHTWFGRFETAVFTREEAIRYATIFLAIALAVTIFALIRQRGLRKRVSRQARLLTENQALLAEAQHLAHLGHWRYDAVRKTLFCSTEMLRIFERDPKHHVLTYSRLLGLVPKAERATVHRTARAALIDGTEGELTLAVSPRPDQRKIVHIKLQAVRGEDGGIFAVVGTVQDITQQKIFEQDLRNREQLLRAIYDNVPSALGVVEHVGETFRFISANPGTSKLLGLEGKADLAGRTLAQLNLPSDVSAFWLQWLRRGMSHTEILKTEASFGDGKRYLSLTLIPLGFGRAGYPQLCFLAEDISERKQIDAEMAQGRRLRAVGELVGGIAHEFNNLLTPILLKAELLSAEWGHDARLRDELASISRAAQRGADLTRRLLAFGRRSDPEPAEVKLYTIARANIDLLRPTIDRRIELINEVPEDLPTLYLNPGDLHQIVLNLLLNARDTLVDKLHQNNPESWRAAIRMEASAFGSHAMELAHWEKSEPPAGWIRLSIRDNGMGMPQSVLERIFEPFYTTKEVGKGTGLGLATVWHLVTRMGGKVNVQSNVGEGTEFLIWLPIVVAPKPTAPRVDTRQPFPTRTSLRICLVEDDELVAVTVVHALRRQEHQVTHFRHGGEAWRHLSQHMSDYDLLLLDLDLPGMHGIEIARRVRNLRYSGKILVASGRMTEEETRDCDAVGVDSRIEKPFTPQKLASAIQACLTSSAGKTQSGLG
ncbi:MAG TPA: transporter substrate-binding domain-containing protein, partial [Opitutaceae bacterium]